MTATVEDPMFTAYCDDCDWESHEYYTRREAQAQADDHNTEYHDGEGE